MSSFIRSVIQNKSQGLIKSAIQNQHQFIINSVRYSSTTYTRPSTNSWKSPTKISTASATTSTTSSSNSSENVTTNTPIPENLNTTATIGEISVSNALDDLPPGSAEPSGSSPDWSTSFHGLSEQAFSKEQAETLLAPIDPLDVEIRPEGLLYLPEIKYRRILNKAFGPGGWGLAPRGEHNIGAKIISREYALVCNGRLVSVARGEQEYYDPSGIATATEGCKSNALMRCCKDLGIASELWDPRFIRKFKKEYCSEAFVEHVITKKKRKLWRRKDANFEYPYKE